jgi:hypothetical protein
MFRAELFHIYSVFDGLLSEDEILFLEEKTKNFIPNTSPSIEKNNSYFRQFINNEVENLSSFINKIENILKTEHYYYSTELSSVWINKIDYNDYQIEEFHRDEEKISTVTFLNDDFEGGFFVYIQPNKMEEKTNPKKYRTILFEGNDIPHKVDRVTNGCRYTLITFWNKKEKNDKSLI